MQQFNNFHFTTRTGNDNIGLKFATKTVGGMAYFLAFMISAIYFPEQKRKRLFSTIHFNKGNTFYEENKILILSHKDGTSLKRYLK
jgi:hypothetical protein